MLTYEQQYLELAQKVLDEGQYVEDRTGTGTYSIFGGMIRHDLSKGFPLLTTKKINFKLVAGELLWFLSGKTDLPSLRKYQNKPENSHTIWSDDFDKFYTTCEDPTYFSDHESGGGIYGKQLRDWGGTGEQHDQLTALISNIKAVKLNPSHPTGRRLRCSFWNPYDHTVGDKIWAALPACHTDFQCIVRAGKLHLSFSMRSNDLFLGNPYNFASYALLCHTLAKLTGLEVGGEVYFGNDIHLYSNHIDQIKLQLEREPEVLPQLVMPEFSTLEELLMLTGEDFVLEGYKPQGFIKAPQAS